MTQYIYIASPLRLPVGTFGLNPISPEQPNVFASELDFTHLHFENNYDSESKERFSYSPHFSFKHQVTTTNNSLPLKHEWISTKQWNRKEFERKCLALLYSYLEKAVGTAYVVEYFTSINGEEHLPISVKRKKHWKDIKKPDDLIIEDREFWEITL